MEGLFLTGIVRNKIDKAGVKIFLNLPIYNARERGCRILTDFVIHALPNSLGEVGSGVDIDRYLCAADVYGRLGV